MKITPKDLNLNYETWSEASKKQGLTIIETKSLEHILRLFFNDEYIETGTDIYIKEESLIKHLEKKIEELRLEYDNYHIIYHVLYKYILKIYHESIEDWTYKEERMTIRTSTNLRNKLNDVPGDSLPKKLNYLVQFYLEHER